MGNSCKEIFLRAFLALVICQAPTASFAEAALESQEPDQANQVENAASESSANAEAQVERFHAALMASTRLAVDYDQRAALLADAMQGVFDIPRIARISAGATWRQLDDAERERYTVLLRDVVVGTYVSRFDADRGQTLSVLTTTEVKPGRHVVRAQIVRPTGAKVALDYYLRDNLVFNVVADGVSDLSVRRADYTAIIKADGFPALLAHLEKKVAAARELLTASSAKAG